MKTMLLLAALTVALGVTPSIAQQGPAGVPGVFGLAESVTAPAPPARAASPAQRTAREVDCSTARQPEQCEAREQMRKKALAACQGKRSGAQKACVNEQMQTMACQKSSDPARCLQHQKARTVCSPKTGAEHRQCLRDNLAARN